MIWRRRRGRALADALTHFAALPPERPERRSFLVGSCGPEGGVPEPVMFVAVRGDGLLHLLAHVRADCPWSMRLCEALREHATRYGLDMDTVLARSDG